MQGDKWANRATDSSSKCLTDNKGSPRKRNKAKQPRGRKDVEKLRSRSPQTKLLSVFLQKALSHNRR